MTLRSAEVRGHVVVHVRGEVEAPTAERLGAAVTAALDGDLPVVLDLIDVRFLDSAGLSTLVRVTERGEELGEPLRIDASGVRSVDDAGQRVRLLVHDDGGRRPPGDPGYRGRGIAVMHGCVAQVRVHPGDDGTEVVLLSRPVPVPRARGAAPMTVAVPQVRSRVRAPGETGR